MSTQKTVNCLYCGGEVAADSSHCPHCNAPSHFQQRGDNPRRRRRFLIFFVAVSLLCALMVFYLPR